MDVNSSNVSDEELNKMIANLKNNQHSSPTKIISNSGSPVNSIQPDASSDSDGQANPVATAIPTQAVPPIPETAEPPVQQDIPPIATSPQPEDIAPFAQPTAADVPNLDYIKKNVLVELRPLITKLNLPADEKFDTILLMIRSTDDVSLIPLASDTARQIVDDTRRAQALLDIIKEIDFFKQTQA